VEEGGGNATAASVAQGKPSYIGRWLEGSGPAGAAEEGTDSAPASAGRWLLTPLEAGAAPSGVLGAVANFWPRALNIRPVAHQGR
jgi:hypothetical protein